MFTPIKSTAGRLPKLKCRGVGKITFFLCCVSFNFVFGLSLSGLEARLDVARDVTLDGAWTDQ
jgi:hypothetical protein